MKIKASRFAAVCFLLLFSALLAPPPALASACTYVSPSSSLQITGPDSVCYIVTNNNPSNNLCVMTDSSAAWQSFYNNPGSASLATCQCSAGTASWLTNCSAAVGALNYAASTGVTNTASGYTGSATVTCNNGSYSYSGTSCSAATCTGTLVGGYCWYASGYGNSCTTACASQGGNNPATINYAGSGGSDANCLAVLNALGLGSGGVTDNAGELYGYGCLYYSGGVRYRDTGSTNYTNSYSQYNRACACGTFVSMSPTSISPVYGSAFSQTITATGGTSPYTYAVTVGSLPTGLSLNSSTGAITGTPTATGAYSFTITATDANSYTGTQAYSGTIAAPTITLSPSSPLTAGTQNSAYSQTITASGGVASYTYAVTSGTLSTGLSLSSGGVLSGTPTGTGTSSFTVTATDAHSQTGSLAYSLTINAACGGTLVGGYCWYAGASGASCDTACTGHGGYNTATLGYAGSGGTDANCAAVAAALGWGSLRGDNTLGGVGCNETFLGPTRDTDPTTSSATSSGVPRACACNN